MSENSNVSDNSILFSIRTLSKTKEFEDICRIASEATIEEIWQSKVLINVLEAYANLGRLDQARVLIANAVLSYTDDRSDIRTLVRMYAFENLLDTSVKNSLRNYIISGLDKYRGEVGGLLHLSHQCLNDGDGKLYKAARNRAIELCGESAELLAKIDIQSSHFYFLRRNYKRQLKYLNDAICKSGLSALKFKNETLPVSAGNIVGGAVDVVEESHRVSVLMTAFNRAHTIEYAARSILNQSYRNIELIIVDDCSSDGTATIINSIAAEDVRVRILLLDANSGTYIAKNRAICMASGDFVTCQDSDDFAHPQKIELGVKHLLSTPDVVGTTVQHVRCNPVDGYKSRVGYIRKDFSSLMFRRAVTLERVGFFDSCRAGADAEFQARIRRVFGNGAIVDLPNLASIVDANADSLTGSGQFAMNDDCGVKSPLRNAYSRAFLKWHASCEGLYMPFPLQERPFVFE